MWKTPAIDKVDEEVCICKTCGTKSIMMPNDIKDRLKMVMRKCRRCDAVTAHVTHWGSYSHS